MEVVRPGRVAWLGRRETLDPVLPDLDAVGLEDFAELLVAHVFDEVVAEILLVLLFNALPRFQLMLWSPQLPSAGMPSTSGDVAVDVCIYVFVDVDWNCLFACDPRRRVDAR